MTRKRLCIVIALIVLFIAVSLVIGAGIAQNHVVSKISAKLQHRLDPLQWQIQIETASWLPTSPCIQSVTLTNDHDDVIEVHQICVDSGLSSVFGDALDLSVSCDRIEASLRWESFEDLKNNKDLVKSSGTIGGTGFSEKNIVAEVRNTHIRIGEKGKQVEFRSANDHYQLTNQTAWADLSVHPAIDIKKFPVAFRNLPEIRIIAMADISQRQVHAFIDSTPAMELAYAFGDKVVETAIHQLNVMASADGVSAEVEDICIRGGENADEVMEIPSACIDSVQADFGALKPSRESLKNFYVRHPVISIDVQKLLKNKSVTENPILSGLVGFWKQDAGAILGSAPNKSVKKADVKKNVPVVQKNPISEKTLLAVREAFDRVQQTILGLPVIDIEDGHMDILNGDTHFAFDAISFNTAELFKNSQQFQLDFNVRQANAQFVIQYSDSSPFPMVDLKIENLRSADFLRLLNMPVPDSNDGRVSLNLNLSMDNDEARMAGNIEFNDFAFFHQKVSPNLVHDIQAAANVDIHYIFKQDLLKIEPISLTSGPLTVAGYINIQNVRSNPTIEFQLGAKDFPCKDLPKAIPAGFFPTITDLQFAGSTISPTITGKIPWNYPLTATLRETGFEGKCYPLTVAPHQPEMLNSDQYTFTTDYTYFVDSITVGPGTSGFVDLEDIPPYVKAAMYLTEDKRMFDNGPLRIGFIERALRLNLNQRKYVYGGSTIAQQLTKNLFLNRNKNLARKLEEAFVTWRLVSVVPKSRILELYLNVIEFGPDVYGIQKAADFYFNKKAKDLTPLEGAYLASLKISPSKGGKYYKLGFANSGRWWNKRLRYIMRLLGETGYITGIDVLSAYDWTPKFYYPPESQSSDYRNIWLNKYGNYLRDKAAAEKSAKPKTN